YHENESQVVSQAPTSSLTTLAPQGSVLEGSSIFNNIPHAGYGSYAKWSSCQTSHGDHVGPLGVGSHFTEEVDSAINPLLHVKIQPLGDAMIVESLNTSPWSFPGRPEAEGLGSPSL
ncbi:hypothetical protein H5410_061380, partial [Solanum commersonii]